jgi:hypothetical protein
VIELSTEIGPKAKYYNNNIFWSIIDGSFTKNIRPIILKSFPAV